MATNQLTELQRDIFAVKQLLQNIQAPSRHPANGKRFSLVIYAVTNIV